MSRENDILLKINDVIQIDPSHDLFGGLFFVVTEVKSGGVQAGLTYPVNREERRSMYGRFEWHQFERIGASEWIQGEDKEAHERG